MVSTFQSLLGFREFFPFCQEKGVVQEREVKLRHVVYKVDWSVIF